MEINFIFQIAILIMSVVIHEVSHGYMAYFLGDPTAKYEGRLTLNPLKHLDPFGSVILPLLLYITHAGFVFGWAKPVPYNPNNLRPGRWSEALVAIAGPFSNLFVALVFGLGLRVAIANGYTNPAVLSITALIVFINVLLMIFNLVPIAPLDGSKLLYALFPQGMYKIRGVYDRFGPILVLVFIFFGWQFIAPLAGMVFTLITGSALG